MEICCAVATAARSGRRRSNFILFVVFVFLSAKLGWGAKGRVSWSLDVQRGRLWVTDGSYLYRNTRRRQRWQRRDREVLGSQRCGEEQNGADLSATARQQPCFISVKRKHETTKQSKPVTPDGACTSKYQKLGISFCLGLEGSLLGAKCLNNPKARKSSLESYRTEKQEDLWSWTVDFVSQNEEEKQAFGNLQS